MNVAWHESKHQMVITRIGPGQWELYHLERRALIGHFKTLEQAKRKAEDHDR
jgi:hypothetical protein